MHEGVRTYIIQHTLLHRHAGTPSDYKSVVVGKLIMKSFYCQTNELFGSCKFAEGGTSGLAFLNHLYVQ